MNEAIIANLSPALPNAPESAFEAFRKALRTQAKIYGQASQSNETIAELIVEHSEMGTINMKDHLESVCQDWQNFCAKGATGETRNTDAIIAASKLALDEGPKKQEAKFKVWFKLGTCDASRMGRAVDAYANIKASVIAIRDLKIKNASTIEQMLTAARKQIDETKEAAKEKRPVKWFTVEEFMSILTPDANDAKVKSEMDQLAVLLKSMQKLSDGTSGNDKYPPKPAFPSTELDQAIALIEQRLGSVKAHEDVTAAKNTLAKYGA